MTVRSLLRTYVGGVHLGEAAAPAPEAVGGLSGHLAGISRANETYFRLCFGALVVLFVGSCAIVVRYLDHPDTIKAVFTVTGLSLVGLVGQMIWLWKQKVTADLVLALSENLPPDQVRQMAEILLAKL